MPENQEEGKNTRHADIFKVNDMENIRAIARSLIEINQILNENQ